MNHKCQNTFLEAVLILTIYVFSSINVSAQDIQTNLPEWNFKNLKNNPGQKWSLITKNGKKYIPVKFISGWGAAAYNDINNEPATLHRESITREHAQTLLDTVNKHFDYIYQLNGLEPKNNPIQFILQDFQQIKLGDFQQMVCIYQKSKCKGVPKKSPNIDDNYALGNMFVHNHFFDHKEDNALRIIAIEVLNKPALTVEESDDTSKLIKKNLVFKKRCGGFSSSPWIIMKQGIALRTRRTIMEASYRNSLLADHLKENTYDLDPSKYDRFEDACPGCAKTLIHELGHQLGLFHTFNALPILPGVGIKKSKKQCYSSGDGICDTPHDFYSPQKAAKQKIYNAMYQFIDSEYESCRVQPFAGIEDYYLHDIYTSVPADPNLTLPFYPKEVPGFTRKFPFPPHDIIPPYGNIMSYWKSRGVDAEIKKTCPKIFTREQLAVMVRVLDHKINPNIVYYSIVRGVRNNGALQNDKNIVLDLSFHTALQSTDLIVNISDVSGHMWSNTVTLDKLPLSLEEPFDELNKFNTTVTLSVEKIKAHFISKRNNSPLHLQVLLVCPHTGKKLGTTKVSIL